MSITGSLDLSDAEWAVIAALLPNRPRGVARVNDRRVISGIFYILRTDAARPYNTDEGLEALAEACKSEADLRLSELRRRRAG